MKKELWVLWSLLAVVLPVSAEELRTTLEDQQAVAVTIYNNNLALVKDSRRVGLVGGQQTLAFRDVSAQLRPETALLRSLTQPGKLQLLEQNFDFDLLSPQKLLEKYVGKQIGVVYVNPATGVETHEQARVLSANNGVVLKIGERIETGVPGRLIYSEVPANLRDRPTLSMLLNNQGAAQHDVELSYLTGGLSWRADYVAELAADDKSLDLSGWVTLVNSSGTTYRNASLQLVAGDVNRVMLEFAQPKMNRAFEVASVAAGAPMQQEALFEYHLYTLGRTTTLAENQSKQVALLNAAAVSVRKELLLQGEPHYYFGQYGLLGQKLKVGAFVEFENKTTSGLGMPLPKGVMRVYKKDSNGNAQFVGEDRLDHTPKNELVRLKLGETFDVTASKKQMTYRVVSRSTHESSYEVELKNAKPEAVEVVVQEPIPGDWRIFDENFPHKKISSNLVEWKLKVPAEGSVTLNYLVQVKN